MKKGYSRTQDYTRSKQELAEQMRAAEELKTANQAEQTRWKTLFGDDPLLNTAQQVAEKYQVPFGQALKAVQDWQAKQQSSQAPQEATPETGADDIATIGQARALFAQERQALQQQLREMQATMAAQIEEMTDKQVKAANEKIVQAQQTLGYVNELNAHAQDVFKRLPVLSHVDNIEDVVRYKVAQAFPATIEEAKDLFSKFADEQAEKIATYFTESSKQKVAAKASLTTNGIEPPGGAGVVPQPVTHKFGSEGLRNAAEAYLKQRQSS